MRLVASVHSSEVSAAAISSRMRMDGQATGASINSTTTKITTATSDAGTRSNGSTKGSEAPVLKLQLVHDPGVTADWSAEEQTILEDGLAKFASETSNLFKYIKVANLLPEKTVRDVAMRCRWMTKKELGKRRKHEEKTTNKKNKENKDKSDAAHNVPFQENQDRVFSPSYIPPSTPADNDDDVSNTTIGGTTGQLLEENAQIIKKIRANLAAYKLPENTDHLLKFRDNLFAILNGIATEPQVMSQMPPLPVTLNMKLADTVLPKPLQAVPSQL